MSVGQTEQVCTGEDADGFVLFDLVGVDAGHSDVSVEPDLPGFGFIQVDG